LKLLFIDIETTPCIAMTWGLRKQNISVEQIVEPTSVLCFAAKWRDKREVIFRKSTVRSGDEFDSMIREAHTLLWNADAVCHFNGESFDIPRLNAEFLRLGLPPPPPIPQIDLKKTAMRKFGTVSSRLAFLGPYLNIGEKVHHEGWPLWTGCLKNDPKSWRTMEKYNRQDVVLLERLYDRILPWIDGHPNMNWYTVGGNNCPTCGHSTLIRRGYRRTRVQIYQRYVCGHCDAWCSARVASTVVAKPEVR
jgi:uncharacterized protein YprB with RNaseH-like and TPR domain